MKLRNTLLGLGSAAVLVTAAAYAWHRADSTAQPRTEPAASAESSTPSADPAQGVATVDEPPAESLLLDVAKLTPEERQNTIVLADGSRVWALNGCKDTEKLIWASHRSKSPVLRIKHGPAYDMYEHADGTLTTTIYVNDPNTGKPGAAGMHLQPIDLSNKPVRTDHLTEDHKIDVARQRKPTR